MNFFLLLAVAFALAMDAFAVSVGLSLLPEGLTNKQTFRMAFHFGFFQFMMPLLGWQATRSILLEYIEPFDHWVAFGLLLIVGVKMIFEFFRTRKETQKNQGDQTKGFSILMLSVATSIDALAVGMSLAALQVTILYPAVVIGVIAFGMTILGTRIGPLLGRLVGRGAELLGGLILILIGAQILVEHL
ncbi:MAG: manganese efflux pump MntP family protein [Candidatus Aminicenantes bacterium]|jgi:putative Mn2+ efflux pump MntP